VLKLAISTKRAEAFRSLDPSFGPSFRALLSSASFRLKGLGSGLAFGGLAAMGFNSFEAEMKRTFSSWNKRPTVLIGHPARKTQNPLAQSHAGFKSSRPRHQPKSLTTAQASSKTRPRCLETCAIRSAPLGFSGLRWKRNAARKLAGQRGRHRCYWIEPQAMIADTDFSNTACRSTVATHRHRSSAMIIQTPAAGRSAA
jgi:hypothetical protein